MIAEIQQDGWQVQRLRMELASHTQRTRDKSRALQRGEKIQSEALCSRQHERDVMRAFALIEGLAVLAENGATEGGNLLFRDGGRILNGRDLSLDAKIGRLRGGDEEVGGV